MLTKVAIRKINGLYNKASPDIGRKQFSKIFRELNPIDFENTFSDSECAFRLNNGNYLVWEDCDYGRA